METASLPALQRPPALARCRDTGHTQQTPVAPMSRAVQGKQRGRVLGQGKGSGGQKQGRSGGQKCSQETRGLYKHHLNCEDEKQKG